MRKRESMLVLLALVALVSAAAQVTVATSIALHGAPKYKSGFDHFDYANPNAPKGGTLRESEIGTYDNFNRFADRGVSSVGADGYFYDTLMTGSTDEVDVYYPLIAEKVEYPADFSWITFDINPKAKAQDGKPMGQDWQTWSAALYLYAVKCVEEKRTPFFDEIRNCPSDSASQA